jgi:transcription initiation factor TFIID TATA-box-binding protein
LSKTNLQQQLLVYENAYKEYLEGVDRSIADLKRLYSQYKLEYEENSNYAIPDVKIVNMVISTFLNNIDVEHLKKDTNTEYYPKRFPGLVFRITKPRSTMLLFKTGKVICTGVKERDSAAKAVEIFLDRYNLKQDVVIDVQNLVVSVDFKYNVELEELANRIPRAIYEPEQFPGIIYRNLEPKAVFLIFTSGKSICVGTKDLGDAFAAVFALRKMMIENELLIEKEDDD